MGHVKLLANKTDYNQSSSIKHISYFCSTQAHVLQLKSLLSAFVAFHLPSCKFKLILLVATAHAADSADGRNVRIRETAYG